VKVDENKFKISSALKSLQKLCMFYFETFWIILNPFSVKKYKATLGNASSSKQKAL